MGRMRKNDYAKSKGESRWTDRTNQELHRIEIQAKDGRLYALTGENLPEALMTNSGHTYKGEHLAQILLRPDQYSTYQASKASAWPNLRDVANFAVGFVSLTILRVLFALVEAL